MRYFLELRLWMSLPSKLRVSEFKFCVKFESGISSGFRSRSGELVGRAALPTWGSKTQTQGAMDFLAKHSNLPYSESQNQHIFCSDGYFAGLYESKPYLKKTVSANNSPFRDRNPELTSDSNSTQNSGSESENLGLKGSFTPALVIFNLFFSTCQMTSSKKKVNFANPGFSKNSQFNQWPFISG